MSTRKKINTMVEREGINYIRSVVEAANCIFHPVHNENDFGIDAIIEFVVNEDVTGKAVAAQIKSGSSFCTLTGCSIQADKNHFSYWSDHSLPVVGIVYDPKEVCAYWVDIKGYIEGGVNLVEKGPYTISFQKDYLNKFDRDAFLTIFSPTFLREPVILDLTTSTEWARSGNYEKHPIGLKSLFFGYRDQEEVWDTFFEVLKLRSVAEISDELLYFLSIAPGHIDIWHSPNNALTDHIKAFTLGKIKSFTRNDVVKLLSFVDDDGIERGSIGQRVCAIVTSVGDWRQILQSIALDTSVDLHLREIATSIVVEQSPYVEIGGLNTLDFLRALMTTDKEMEQFALMLQGWLN